MATREVEFNEDYQVKDAEGKKYYKGKKYPMSEASANHFVKRGLAEKIKNRAEIKAEKDAIAAEKHAKKLAQLADEIAAAATVSKEANLAVVEAENALQNADDEGKKAAKAMVDEAKEHASKAAKELKALEK